MWSELLPTLAGRQMTDLDGPPVPAATTRIVSAFIERQGDQEFVTLHGEGYDWRCDQQYASVAFHYEDGTIHLHGLCGMHLRIAAGLT